MFFILLLIIISTPIKINEFYKTIQNTNFKMLIWMVISMIIIIMVTSYWGIIVACSHAFLIFHTTDIINNLNTQNCFP